MGITFRKGIRQGFPLLLGVSGGTGSGKTFSALRLARGIAQDGTIAFIDTENGRALMYADDFQFDHGELHAPFRPQAYADAIEAADKIKPRVIVVDSASHEWAGDGGCLDWQAEIMKGQESRRLMSWIEPKMAHKRMVTRLLQIEAHVILCFRAEPKVEVSRTPDGKTEIVPKKAAGKALDGWMPISEPNLPYEMTASFLLMNDAPGVPKPIKLPEKLKPFVPLDRPLSEEVGLALATWAAGPGADLRTSQSEGVHAAAGLSLDELTKKLRETDTIELAGEIAAVLYPGKNAATLTDLERADVWTEVQSQKEATTSV